MIAIYRRQTSYCLRTEALCFEGRVGVDIVFFERVLIQSWSLKKVFLLCPTAGLYQGSHRSAKMLQLQERSYSYGFYSKWSALL